MKKRKLIALLAVALGLFTACTQEEDPNSAATTSATLTISNIGSSTKADDDGTLISPTDAESTITKCYIGCFDASGALIDMIQFSGFTKSANIYSKSGVTLKTATRKILVIANSADDYSSKTKYSDFASLLTTTTTPLSGGNLIKVGELDFTAAPVAGSSYNINVTQLSARIDVIMSISKSVPTEVTAVVPIYTAAQVIDMVNGGTLPDGSTTGMVGDNYTVTIPGFQLTKTQTAQSWQYNVSALDVDSICSKSDLLLPAYATSGYTFNQFEDVILSEQSFTPTNDSTTFYTYEKSNATTKPIKLTAIGNLVYTYTSKVIISTCTATFTWANATSPSGEPTISYGTETEQSTTINPTSTVTTPKKFSAIIKEGATKGLVHGYIYKVLGTITPVTATNGKINWAVLSADDVVIPIDLY